MTKVTAQMSVSLDGYYAGPRYQGGGSGWMDSAEAAGFFRVTQWVLDAMAWRERQGLAGGEQNVSSEIIAESFEAAGAYVMGRRMADGGEEPWGEEPPFHAPVFVVTNRPRETLVRKGGTTFTYVTDGLAAAVEQARAAADGRNVAVAGGGTLLRQVLWSGLLDELDLHIAPVVLGTGMRLLDGQLPAPIELTPARVVPTPQVTHLRYTVNDR
ncbi:dihydrofolate reductase family protein [Dactylosporangium sp. AC04546]|uniref:dihydrofolate reductase family protein n=1 Tax=Dactylosporangium sp. AC04546 TaxID=2862460 RepID=UPI001EDF80DA|nr:dihydrofolate reductase family protein [Dactylosporangium sp. AC04546]WVK88612.1 dihydrofolate reductase family protein [Dactylosporangium sp. AC04546]